MAETRDKLQSFQATTDILTVVSSLNMKMSHL